MRYQPPEQCHQVQEFLTLMASRYSCLEEPEPPWNTKKTSTVSQHPWPCNASFAYQASCCRRRASQRRRPGACRAARGAGGRCRGHRHRERYCGNRQTHGLRSPGGLEVVLPKTGSDGEVLGDRAESLLAARELAMSVNRGCGSNAHLPNVLGPGSHVSTYSISANTLWMARTGYRGQRCQP